MNPFQTILNDIQDSPQDVVVLNTIIQADCLAALPHLADDSVDLTVFSPPYDAIRDYYGGWTLDHRALGQQLFRVTKGGGVCALVIGDGTKDFAKSLTTARWTLDWCDNAGWRLFERCIYARHGNPGAWWSRRFRVDHEAILIFFKGRRPKTFDKTPLMVSSRHAGKLFSGTDRQTDSSLKPITPKAVNPMKCRGTVWQCATSNSEDNHAKRQHPATFPDALARDLILCFSAPGDLVLDPTAGSGTTCVAAALLGRRYLGTRSARNTARPRGRGLRPKPASASPWKRPTPSRRPSPRCHPTGASPGLLPRPPLPRGACWPLAPRCAAPARPTSGDCRLVNPDANRAAPDVWGLHPPSSSENFPEARANHRLHTHDNRSRVGCRSPPQHDNQGVRP